jgi:hypothetical protein
LLTSAVPRGADWLGGQRRLDGCQVIPTGYR